MTVLIGEAGGGGGAVSAATSANIAGTSPLAIAFNSPQTGVLNASFKDKSGKPIAGIRYSIEYPDGSVQNDLLSGAIKRSGSPRVHITLL